jgi:hypothetical protein
MEGKRMTSMACNFARRQSLQYYMDGIFYRCNMSNPLEQFRRQLLEAGPDLSVEVDEPDSPDANWWIDIRRANKRITIEYRPRYGFGLFHQKSGYGEGPAEIYRTPELAARRVAQLLKKSGRNQLNLRDLRELYGHSQIKLAAKVGVKQSAISRFENRDQVKLSTLAAAVEALGGKLEVRAHFSDSDVPISTDT